MTSFLSLLNWDYLAYRQSIFSQILICCSWDNSLQEIWHCFFILMTSSQWNSRLKATMQNFSDLRVMSRAGDFFSKHESAWQCFFDQYLGCSSTVFSQILVCCSWDYGLSKMWSQIFNQMSGTWSNFQFKMTFESTQRLNFCQWDDVTVYK